MLHGREHLNQVQYLGVVLGQAGSCVWAGFSHEGVGCLGARNSSRARD